MRVRRSNHGCGQFTYNQTKILIVAGGQNKYFKMSTTEFLIQNNGIFGRWMYGPRLPRKMTYPVMVSDESKVYLIDSNHGTILKLKCPETSLLHCQWITLNQRTNLNQPIAAKLVPDYRVDCQVTKRLKVPKKFF